MLLITPYWILECPLSIVAFPLVNILNNFLFNNTFSLLLIYFESDLRDMAAYNNDLDCGEPDVDDAGRQGREQNQSEESLQRQQAPD